jgi:hypothetical protein
VLLSRAERITSLDAARPRFAESERLLESATTSLGLK